MRRPDRGATSLAVLAPLLAVLAGGGTAVAATYVVVTTQAPATPAAPADAGGSGGTGGGAGDLITNVPYGGSN